MSEQEKLIILDASNTINYLNKVIHGIAAGQSMHLKLLAAQNAKEHFQVFDKSINDYINNS